MILKVFYKSSERAAVINKYELKGLRMLSDTFFTDLGWVMAFTDEFHPILPLLDNIESLKVRIAALEAKVGVST